MSKPTKKKGGRPSNAEVKSRSAPVLGYNDVNDVVCHHCNTVMRLVDDYAFDATERDLQLLKANGPFYRCPDAGCMRIALTEDLFDDQTCHFCGANMEPREGDFGPFLSCTNWPKTRCEGKVALRYLEEDEVLTRDPAPDHIPLSDEQAAVLETVKELLAEFGAADGVRTLGDFHIRINALAGVGKTFLLSKIAWWIVRRLHNDLPATQPKIRAVTFSNKAARELSIAMPEPITASSWHRLGKQMLTDWGFGGFETKGKLAGTPKKARVDPKKIQKIMARLIPLPPYSPNDWNDEKAAQARENGFKQFVVGKLVSLAETQLMVSLQEDDPQPTDSQLDYLCARFGLSFKADYRGHIYDTVRQVIRISLRELSTFSLDELVVVPALLPVMKPEHIYDILIIDEAQDNDPAQIELARRIARAVFDVGDDNQAIYGFRGATHHALDDLALALQAPEAVRPAPTRSFPMTLTRRCYQSVTEEARKLVPAYRTARTELGEVKVIQSFADLTCPPEELLVLARTNAKLVPAALQALREGHKVIIEGKDIGKDLKARILRLNAWTKTEALAMLRSRASDLQNKLKGKKGRGAAALIEELDMLQTAIWFIDASPDVRSALRRITELFRDTRKTGRPKGAIVFASVHKVKGLQSRFVLIVGTELFPHPLSVDNPDDLRQEWNLLYVAITRAIEGLYYLGSRPTVLEVGLDAMMALLSKASTKTVPVAVAAGADEGDEDETALYGDLELEEE